MRWVLLSAAICAALTSTGQGQGLGTVARRIAWDQHAPAGTAISSYVFTLFVDGVDSPLGNASCEPTAAPTAYDCVATLPELAPGSHTLQLATSVVSGGRVLRSERSSAIHLTIPPDGPTGPIATTATDRWRADQVTTTEGVLLNVERIASGLRDATDLAFGSEGVLFVAERAGTVRIVHNNVLHPNPALKPQDVSPEPGVALLSLVLDPAFDRNGLAYIAYAAQSAGALKYALARFRHAGGILAERAVLLNGIPADEQRLAASLRFGPDGKLYAAFGDTIEERRHDAASFNGKVLRLNADGTTPVDAPAASPVFASGLRAPGGLAWDATGALWIVDATDDGSAQLRRVTTAAHSGAAPEGLRAQSGASSLASYDHALIPGFRGSLLMGATNVGHIFRVRVAPDTTPANAASIERLLQDQVDPIRVVAVSPDGEIYFCTADAVGRIVPD